MLNWMKLILDYCLRPHLFTNDLLEVQIAIATRVKINLIKFFSVVYQALKSEYIIQTD